MRVQPQLDSLLHGKPAASPGSAIGGALGATAGAASDAAPDKSAGFTALLAEARTVGAPAQGAAKAGAPTPANGTVQQSAAQSLADPRARGTGDPAARMGDPLPLGAGTPAPHPAKALPAMTATPATHATEPASHDAPVVALRGEMPPAPAAGKARAQADKTGTATGDNPLPETSETKSPQPDAAPVVHAAPPPPPAPADPDAATHVGATIEPGASTDPSPGQSRTDTQDSGARAPKALPDATRAAEMQMPTSGPTQAPAADTPAPPVFSVQVAPVAAPSDVTATGATPAAPLDLGRADWPQSLVAALKSPEAAAPGDAPALTLTLTPERLGTLHIRLEQQDGLTHVQIVTETPEAARLLDQAQHRLADLMTRAGLEMGSQSTTSQDPRSEAGQHQHADRHAPHDPREPEPAAGRADDAPDMTVIPSTLVEQGAAGMAASVDLMA